MAPLFALFGVLTTLSFLGGYLARRTRQPKTELIVEELSPEDTADLVLGRATRTGRSAYFGVYYLHIGGGIFRQLTPEGTVEMDIHQAHRAISMSAVEHQTPSVTGV